MADKEDKAPEGNMQDKTEDSGESTVQDKKAKRRLRPAAPSIREQREKASAKNTGNGTGTPQRNLFVRILRFPFVLLFWPVRMLFRYIIVPPFRFLNRFKFFRVIGYIIVPPYFRSAFRELRLVTWPGTRETVRLVIAVLIFSIVFGLIVAGVDFVLDKVFRAYILNK